MTAVAFTILAAVFVGLAVHEAGHYAAARLIGYPARIVVCRWGVGTLWGTDDRVSPPEDRFVVVTAGPGASAVGGLALAAIGVGWWPLVVWIGVVQLLPFPKSDGRNAWVAYRALRNSGATKGESNAV